VVLAMGTAQADPTPARLASITFENDFFAGYDRRYTNGVQVNAQSAFYACRPEGNPIARLWLGGLPTELVGRSAGRPPQGRQ
jgi:hypothetical protein